MFVPGRMPICDERESYHCFVQCVSRKKDLSTRNGCQPIDLYSILRFLLAGGRKGDQLIMIILVSVFAMLSFGWLQCRLCTIVGKKQVLSLSNVVISDIFCVVV